jgi:fumarate reductase flavoprotein subunit
VLNKDWEKIAGLYAAGTDACTIYGDSYVFVLPGNTMGFAVNSGRIAGENAAAYAKSVSP